MTLNNDDARYLVYKLHCDADGIEPLSFHAWLEIQRQKS
jgi:hypothetical protein